MEAELRSHEAATESATRVSKSHRKAVASIEQRIATLEGQLLKLREEWYGLTQDPDYAMEQVIRDLEALCSGVKR